MHGNYGHFFVNEAAIVWIVLVVVGVLLAYVWSAWRRSEDRGTAPEDIVKQRYARGEIDQQTYRSMLVALQAEGTQKVKETKYGFGTHFKSPSFESAVEQVTHALKDEGFGVLTEIDVQATLKKKLGAEFRRYVILGACNPPLAKRALDAEPEIGLLLPCNVVVQEAEGDETEVLIADPKAMFTLVDNDAVAPIAEDAEQRLRRVLASLSNGSLPSA